MWLPKKERCQMRKDKMIKIIFPYKEILYKQVMWSTQREICQNKMMSYQKREIMWHGVTTSTFSPPSCLSTGWSWQQSSVAVSWLGSDLAQMAVIAEIIFSRLIWALQARNDAGRDTLENILLFSYGTCHRGSRYYAVPLGYKCWSWCVSQSCDQIMWLWEFSM